jgi:hypothetical protein
VAAYYEKMIPPASSSYLAALVLKINGSASAQWEPVAMFDSLGAATDYAKMSGSDSPEYRYLAAEVVCAPQDLVPIGGGLPLFRRTFPREAFEAAAGPSRSDSSAAAAIPLVVCPA